MNVLLTVFLVVFGFLALSVNAQQVKNRTEYCNLFGKRHIMCKYDNGDLGKDCSSPEPQRLTQKDKDAIVAKHNELRSKVALGNEARGSPGPLPKASNMQQMVWDDELAAIAERWADQCIIGAASPATRKVERFSVGQNYGRIINGHPAWSNIVQGWYDQEIILPNADLIDSYESYDETEGVKYRQVSQILWATTNRVGCGAIQMIYPRNNPDKKSEVSFVCNYGPAGNEQGSSVYIAGDPGTGCLTNMKFQNQTGLCA